MSPNPSIEPVINRKIRFALVGCGRISKNHFDATGPVQLVIPT
jgi:hypothetical protein